jgi:hypothetical protein
MIEAENDDRFDDAEIVCDGNSCWLGIRRVRIATVHELLRVMALKDSSAGSKVQRYLINGSGRALHAKPELAQEIVAAVIKGLSFTIENGLIKTIASPLSAADD